MPISCGATGRAAAGAAATRRRPHRVAAAAARRRPHRLAAAAARLLLPPLLLLLLAAAAWASSAPPPPALSPPAPPREPEVDEADAGDGEGGTKWMLDQAAAMYVRARIASHRVVRRMEALGRRARTGFVGRDPGRFRACAQFYAQTARLLDEKVELMNGLAAEIEWRRAASPPQLSPGHGGGLSSAVQRQQRRPTRRPGRHDDELAILLEFQRHLFDRGADNGDAHSHVTSGLPASLPPGRIAVFDRMVAEYMAERSSALFAIRQVRAIVGLMADGLPRRWAQRYLEVMQQVEQHGLSAIAEIAVVWGDAADQLAAQLAQRERATGVRQYSYGGDGDPDGRMLVVSVFTSLPEWGGYVAGDRGVGGKKDAAHEEEDGRAAGRPPADGSVEGAGWWWRWWPWQWRPWEAFGPTSSWLRVDRPTSAAGLCHIAGLFVVFLVPGFLFVKGMSLAGEACGFSEDAGLAAAAAVLAVCALRLVI